MHVNGTRVYPRSVYKALEGYSGISEMYPNTYLLCTRHSRCTRVYPKYYLPVQYVDETRIVVLRYNRQLPCLCQLIVTDKAQSVAAARPLKLWPVTTIACLQRHPHSEPRPITNATVSAGAATLRNLDQLQDRRTNLTSINTLSVDPVRGMLEPNSENIPPISDYWLWHRSFFNRYPTCTSPEFGDQHTRAEEPLEGGLLPGPSKNIWRPPWGRKNESRPRMVSTQSQVHEQRQDNPMASLDPMSLFLSL